MKSLGWAKNAKLSPTCIRCMVSDGDLHADTTTIGGAGDLFIARKQRYAPQHNSGQRATMKALFPQRLTEFTRVTVTDSMRMPSNLLDTTAELAAAYVRNCCKQGVGGSGRTHAKKVTHRHVLPPPCYSQGWRDIDWFKTRVPDQTQKRSRFIQSVNRPSPSTLHQRTRTMQPHFHVNGWAEGPWELRTPAGGF